MMKALVEEAAAMVVRDGVAASGLALPAQGHFHHGEDYAVLIDLRGTYLVFPPRPTPFGVCSR